MSRLSRILASPRYFWILGAGLTISHVLLSIQAWQGNKFSLACIVVLWVGWTILALRAQALNRRVLSQIEAALDGWQETNDLARDYGNLLTEATDELSTWDREKSDDILSRTTTISLMRAQNMKRRMTRERPRRRSP